jgi:hypothetical protein
MLTNVPTTATSAPLCNIPLVPYRDLKAPSANSVTTVKTQAQ